MASALNNKITAKQITKAPYYNEKYIKKSLAISGNYSYLCVSNDLL